MYCIAIYDAEAKKDPKINKAFKQYLNWVQNSVFEGNIELSQYRKLLAKIESIISEQDSVLIYKFRNDKYLEKDMLGRDISNLWSNFLV